MDIDMMRGKEEVNKQQHNSSSYSSEHLIVRRGQEFQVRIIFNRPYKPAADQFAVEFVIGEDRSRSFLCHLNLRYILLENVCNVFLIFHKSYKL